MSNIAIFASGTGSNARRIIEYFENKPDIDVKLVLSNKSTAPVLEMARDHGISTLTFDRKSFYETEVLLEQLHQYQIDFIVLAGFLWLVPPYLVQAYTGKIVNIHPALLPRYGGPGMYGGRVHAAVLASGATHSGCTVHLCDDEYDRGPILLQRTCPVLEGDDVHTLAARVFEEEMRAFPEALRRLIEAGHQS